MINVVPDKLKKRSNFFDAIKQGKVVKLPQKWVPTHKGLELPTQAVPEDWMPNLMDRLNQVLAKEHKAPLANGKIDTFEFSDSTKADLYKWLDVKSDPRDGILGIQLESGIRIEVTTKGIFVLRDKEGIGQQLHAPTSPEIQTKLNGIFLRTPNQYKGSKVCKEVATGLIEASAATQGHRYLVGIDESGRGNWAGPLTAAAVLWDTQTPNEAFSAVKDCKGLSYEETTALYMEIAPNLPHGVGIVSAEELNKLGNLDLANQLAFTRALDALVNKTGISPDLVMLDGTSIKLPEGTPYKFTQHPQGETNSKAIAAASVIAKHIHDAEMERLHELHPLYKFHLHKGSGTTMHKELVTKHGPCPEHRIHFAPIKKLLPQKNVKPVQLDLL
jgi:ribonuclease HII